MASIQEFLKEGTKYLTGLEEAILRNIEAARKLSDIARTSLGPNGMNKLVVNHLEKLFVTSDTATILKELEVVHPAARMLVMACQMQESEVGDGTNATLVLAGEFLQKAEWLLRTGLHPSEVVSGYEKAGKKALEILETLASHSVADLRDEAAVAQVLAPVFASKQQGYEGTMAPLIAKACIEVLPKNTADFSVDDVRVAKILGAGVGASRIVKGMVLARGTEGFVKSVKDAKVAVFSVDLEMPKTETKGTVLLHNADELLNFSKSEEKQMEEIVKAISERGVKVVITGGSVGEIPLHFFNRMGILVLKTQSKFELRRLCKTVGATSLVHLGAPTPDDLGYCSSIHVEEIGSTSVTIVRQDAEASQIATIVLRASSNNILEDMERAVDDCVNVFKQMTKNARFVPGAGACEMELARQLTVFGSESPGLDQYAIKRFAEAFEVIPRTLGETAGLDCTQIITQLYAAHEKPDGANFGVNIVDGGVLDVSKAVIWDSLLVKRNAVKLAFDVAVTILRVDQIIMAKRAGGPGVRPQGARDDD